MSSDDPAVVACLSDDDGRAGQGGPMLDERPGVSYFDAVEAPDGTIQVIYDDRRQADKMIRVATLKQDVLQGA